MRAGTPIAERWAGEYRKWSQSSFLYSSQLICELIEALSASEERQRVLREALERENAALKATVERIRHPKVYEGATFYTQADVPDMCPECDGRNFISYGVKGMVCLACCLMRDLEEAEATVERLSAPVSDAEYEMYYGHGGENGRPKLFDALDINLLITGRAHNTPPAKPEAAK